MNQETKRPIALEDILRLKRAERPPPEFWAAFDRELRAKQLAALVEKRPWWRTLPRPLFGFSRYHLPLGAAAILAITFIAMRDFRPAAPTSSAEPSLPTVVAHAPAIVSAPAVANVEESSARSLAESAIVPTNETSVAASFAKAETLAPGEVTRLLLGVTEPVRSDAPAARSISEHFKIAQAAAPAIERGLLSQHRGFEGRALAARAAPIEPLVQMTSPAAARTAKFNSVLASSFAPETSSRASERVARRLSNDSEDRLYETAYRRIKTRGNDTGMGVDFKF